MFKKWQNKKNPSNALEVETAKQSHLLRSQRKVIAFEMIVEVLAVLKYVRMVKDHGFRDSK